MKKSDVIKIVSCAVITLFTLTTFSKITIGHQRYPRIYENIQNVSNQDVILIGAVLKAGLRVKYAGDVVNCSTGFPLTGPLDIHGGTLDLGSDLVLNDVSSFVTLGNIIGNHHSFILPQSVSVVPELQSFTFENVQRVDQLGDGVFDVDWTYDGGFLVAANTYNVNIYSVDTENATPLAFQDQVSTGSRVVNAIQAHPNTNVIAIATEADGTNSNLCLYHINESTGALSLLDKKIFTEDVVALSWHPSGDYLVVGLSGTTDNVKVYHLYSDGTFDDSIVETFSIDNAAIQNRSLEFDHRGNFIAVGVNESSVGKIHIVSFSYAPTVALTLKKAFAYASGAVVTSISWNKTYSSILAVGLNPSSASGQKMSVLEYRSSLNTCTEIETISEVSNFDTNSVCWHPSGFFLARGMTDYSGGKELQIYAYHGINKSLVTQPEYEEEFGGAVTAACWHPKGNMLAVGNGSDATVDPNNLGIYSAQVEDFTFSDLAVKINGRVKLSGASVTFSGTSEIDGFGHVLELDDTSKITVAADSTLLLKNISIEGLQGKNIALASSTSKIVFENVSLHLKDDFTFDTGSFEVLRALSIQGAANEFAYTSNNTSIIEELSSLSIGKDVTFTYAPQDEAKDKIIFIDNTSAIIFKDATLNAPLGIRFVNGKVSIKGKTVFKGYSTSSIQEMVIAQNMIDIGADNKTSDCMLVIHKGGSLYCQNGTLAYRNTQIDSFVAEASDSQLKIASGAMLALYQTLTVSPSRLIFEDGANVGFYSDATIIGSVVPEGQFGRITLLA